MFSDWIHQALVEHANHPERPQGIEPGTFLLRVEGATLCLPLLYFVFHVNSCASMLTLASSILVLRNGVRAQIQLACARTWPTTSDIKDIVFVVMAIAANVLHPPICPIVTSCPIYYMIFDQRMMQSVMKCPLFLVLGLKWTCWTQLTTGAPAFISLMVCSQDLDPMDC